MEHSASLPFPAAAWSAGERAHPWRARPPPRCGRLRDSRWPHMALGMTLEALASLAASPGGEAGDEESSPEPHLPSQEEF
eukprot:scaffold105638_cov32-Tisochrysis_lutea.AAC.2